MDPQNPFRGVIGVCPIKVIKLIFHPINLCPAASQNCSSVPAIFHWRNSTTAQRKPRTKSAAAFLAKYSTCCRTRKWAKYAELTLWPHPCSTEYCHVQGIVAEKGLKLYKLVYIRHQMAIKGYTYNFCFPSVFSCLIKRQNMNIFVLKNWHLFKNFS